MTRWSVLCSAAVRWSYTFDCDLHPRIVSSTATLLSSGAGVWADVAGGVWFDPDTSLCVECPPSNRGGAQSGSRLCHWTEDELSPAQGWNVHQKQCRRRELG